MKFSHTNLARLLPAIPAIETVAEKITAHLFEVESYENGVLDLKILPNRYSDAACYRGIAREIAAACGLPYKEPKRSAPKAGHKKKTVPVIEIPNLCRRLMACRIENVSLGTTPAWMKEALETYGIRPINGIVDITNYVTIETGQPLHAFDAGKMEGANLVARQARAGETVTTLDGKAVTLNPSALVLSDGAHALDIAGIKGGTRAEITAKTESILLTAGNFDGALIYKTAKRVGIATDASVRFSHNLSPALAERGICRALELIAEICGGIPGLICDTYPKPVRPAAVPFDAKRFNAFTGLGLSESACILTLKSLGFAITGKKAVPPAERTDIGRFEDLAEEIVRIRGYAALPAIPPHIAVTATTDEPMRTLKDDVQDMLVNFGYSEIRTRSFSSSGEVALENPLAPEQSFLRASLTESLSGAVAVNLKSFDTAALFEIGSVFHKKATHEPVEEVRCGIALAGKGITEEDAFRAVRGVVESLIADLGVAGSRCTEDGKMLAVMAGTETVGTIARLNGVRGGACAELSLAKLLPCVSRARRFAPIPKYPSIVRDVSFVVDVASKAGAVMDAAWHDVPDSLADIRFMGLYRGAGVPEGKKSVTLRFVFQSKEKTLTDAEADSLLSYVTDGMKERIAFEIK